MRRYPIIILSLEGSGRLTSNYIQKRNNERSDFKRNSLFRVIDISNSGSFKCESKSFDSGLDISKGSKENFINLTNNRTDLFSFINEVIFDVFNIQNRNIFTGEGIQLNNEPTIMLIGSICHPFLAVLNKIFFTNRESLAAHSLCPIHTLCMLQEESFQNRKENRFFQIAFFKEIYDLNDKHLILDQHQFWLIDNINEIGLQVGALEEIPSFIERFVDMIFKYGTNYSTRVAENGRTALFSSFGNSCLLIPDEKLKSYLKLWIQKSELENLIHSFDLKFLKENLRNELSSFFNRERWMEIHDQIAFRENGKRIYQPFGVDITPIIDKERESSYRYKLKVPESGLAEKISSEARLKIDDGLRARREIEDEIYAELESSCRRELDRLNHSVDSQIENILNTDHRNKANCQGVNFALTFCSLMNNDESSVQDYLEQSSQVRYQNLFTIQDNIREKIMGDELSRLDGQKQDNRNNLNDKRNIIEEHKESNKNAEIAIEKLNNNSEQEDSPKVIELKEEIKVKKLEIDTLQEELVQHELNIQNLTNEITQIKNNFDRHEFRERLKKEQIKKYDDEIAATQINIDDNDKILSRLYLEKSKLIEKRKKILFKDVILIPSIFLLVMALINIILFYKAPWVGFLKWRLIISFGIIVFFLVKGLISFFKINQELLDKIGEIRTHLNEKQNLFIKLLGMVDGKSMYTFNFDKNMAAYNLLEKTISNTNERISVLNGFKEKISTQRENISRDIDDIQFSPSSFDFSLISKTDIKKIYEIENQKVINNGKEIQNLSNYYNEFHETNQLQKFLNDCEQLSDEIYEYRLKKVSIKDVLNNNVSFIQRQLKSELEIEKIFDSSRPLLDTERSHITPGVPYTLDILIGKTDSSSMSILKRKSLNLSANTHQDENDSKILGLMTIKSNILPYLLHNAADNENYLRKNLKKNEIPMYFTNEKVNEVQLSGGVTTRIDDDASLKRDFFQFLLFYISGIIEFNNNNERFENKGLVLGNNVNEAINFLNTPNAYELKEELSDFLEELPEINESQKNEYIDRTIQLLNEYRAWFSRKMLKLLPDFLFETFEASDEKLKELDKLIKNKN